MSAMLLGEESFDLKERLLIESHNEDELDEEQIEKIYDHTIHKKMWTKEYIGLYAHYAGVGINGGISGLVLNFCVYYFHGSSTLCPNASSIIFLPWRYTSHYSIYE